MSFCTKRENNFGIEFYYSSNQRRGKIPHYYEFSLVVNSNITRKWAIDLLLLFVI